MLYPVHNNFRSILDLSGFWKFKADPLKIGEKKKWYKVLKTKTEIAVPGSWNEQLAEEGLSDFIGTAWYSKKCFIPKDFQSKKIWLRVGSADYYSKVWVNGKFVGENHFGFLPYEFEITEFISFGVESEITILVNNELDNETVPQGITSAQFLEENRLREETNPPSRFDFYPFGGIHRPVQIIATPHQYISKIKVDTGILGVKKGRVKAEIEVTGVQDAKVAVSIGNGKQLFSDQTRLANNRARGNLIISDCKFWSPQEPFLYELQIHLISDNKIIDEYVLPVGVREVKVRGNKLYINNKSIYLKGFGKHEDFSTIGKGLFLPLIVKDFELMKWLNANSFRTSHYPYSEEMMYYADRKGILVIDEVPAVSLDTRYANNKSIRNHKEYIRRLIERDYNHPSVIMWSAGNEPNLVGAEEYYDGTGKKYWKEIFSYARSLDSSRPITVPNCSRAGINDPVFEFSDVLSLNRYYGWYEYPGKLKYAAEILSKEMDAIYKKYKKPILFTEFGADTLPGSHSTSDQMFTEEYQASLIEMYIKVIRSKTYTIGEQLWNFADFKTPQHFRRVVQNLKGIFTRERSPKLAAFKVKEIWK
ncbi:MAG: beta-glucuronidase [Bacteroidetes bacterium]|nr:beta-glucuronidase [Bacteroidota bacterium]